MKRSDFLKTVGALSAGALLPISFIAAPEPKPEPSLLDQIDNRATHKPLTEDEFRKVVQEVFYNYKVQREQVYLYGSPDMMNALEGIS